MTQLAVTQGTLTLDDLERLAFKYGGSVEPRPGGKYVLVGALINNVLVNLGPATR